MLFPPVFAICCLVLGISVLAISLPTTYRGLCYLVRDACYLVGLEPIVSQTHFHIERDSQLISRFHQLF